MGSGLAKKERAERSPTGPWDEDRATPLAGGVVCRKRIPSGGGGPWPIWRQIEKCSLRSLSDAAHGSDHMRLMPIDPDRARRSHRPWVTPPNPPKLKLTRSVNLLRGITGLHCRHGRLQLQRCQAGVRQRGRRSATGSEGGGIDVCCHNSGDERR